MIEMAFIKVHDGLKLATDQNLNSPHVCHVLMVTAAGLAQDCPTLGAARWFGVSYSWQTGILDELQRLKHSGPLEHPSLKTNGGILKSFGFETYILP